MESRRNRRHHNWSRPSGRWRRLVVAAVAALVLAVPGVADADDQGFQEIEGLLSAWQVQQAGERIEQFAGDAEGTPHLHYLQGRHAFYTGDYERALEHMDRVLEMEDHPSWRRFRDIVADTVEVTEDYERHVSESGNFEIWVEPGPDEVLVPFALEALEEAYDEIGEILGHRPDERVRVEVYPRESVLADVSELTEENIRTSGTIALCQYNRLMITSPRAVLRGYSWVDTLIHEYVHLVINQRTVEDVPIWMHEALAKYLERAWRGDGEQMLEGSSEQLLRERHEDDDLVGFEEMHPSMAKLPSREDAAVAFAQVYTTAEYLDEQLGEGAFDELLDNVDAGMEARRAYAEVVEMDWEEFENHEWRRYLHHRPLPELPDDPDDMYDDELVFEDEAAEHGSELDQIEAPRARDHLQMGQMLQVRERYGAAAVQYEKAEAIIGDDNPVLQSRMARTLTKSGDGDKAVEALQTVKQLHPYHVTTWLELGRAHLEEQDYGQAREALVEAARINPFNPEIHELLARVADELGEHDKAERSRRFVELVGS